MNFSQWLSDELKEREWSNADLARKSKLSRQSIGYYLTGRIPDADSMVKIARAFGVTIETVYRHADMLPPKSERDSLEEEAEHLFKQIKGAENRETALKILRVLGGGSKKRQVTKNRAATENE